jgi:hypothetical protein
MEPLGCPTLPGVLQGKRSARTPFRTSAESEVWIRTFTRPPDGCLRELARGSAVPIRSRDRSRSGGLQMLMRAACCHGVDRTAGTELCLPARLVVIQADQQFIGIIGPSDAGRGWAACMAVRGVALEFARSRHGPCGYHFDADGSPPSPTTVQPGSCAFARRAPSTMFPRDRRPDYDPCGPGDGARHDHLGGHLPSVDTTG